MEVIRSCSSPISSARVGWYPTAEGMRPRRVETSEPAWTKRKMLSMNKQHVLVLHVPEVLGHRQRRERHAKAHARRLVHLAVDEGGLGDDAGLLHLEPEVGALTGTLADAGEDGHAAVLLRDAVDHLLDEDRLADTRPPEQADLAALDVGLEQVDDLDPGLEHLATRLEGVEVRRRAVDLPPCVRLAHLARIEPLSDDVEDVA